MGNSEVGRDVGAGRIIRPGGADQRLVRSNQLGDTQALKGLAERTQKGGTLHMAFAPMGASTAMWTSVWADPVGCRQRRLRSRRASITDGRDTHPGAPSYISQVEAALS